MANELSRLNDAVDSRDPAPMVKRRESQLAELEQRWQLIDREPGADSRNHTSWTVGAEAVAAIDREYEASRRRREIKV